MDAASAAGTSDPVSVVISEDCPVADEASAPIRSDPQSSASTGSSRPPSTWRASVSTPPKVSSTATGANRLATSGSAGWSASMPSRISEGPRPGTGSFGWVRMPAA